MLGETSGIEVKSPKDVIIASAVGVCRCQSYKLPEAAGSKTLSSEAVVVLAISCQMY